MSSFVGRHWPAAVTVLAVLLASSRARSEPVPTSTAASYATEVRSTPLSSHPDPTQRSTRVSAPSLERARARGLDVPDLIDLVAGARVLDLGGPAHEKRLSLRGSAATGTALVVDGVPLSSPFATGLDLGLVPIEGIEELSIVHGGAGAIYGSGALGGAVLIRTRPLSQRPSTVSLALGSLETVLLRGAVHAHDLSAAGAYEQSSGSFPYLSRLSGLPDLERVRGNNDVRRGLLSASYERTLGPGQLELSAAGAVREAGVPGFETQENLEARERRLQAQTRVAFVRPGGTKALRLEAAAHLRGLGIDYEDALGAEPSQTTFFATGLDLAVAAPFDAEHRWSGRLELGTEHSASTEHGDHLRPRGAAVLTDELALGPFTLFGALRGELYAGQRIGILPRLGASWSPSSILELGLALGRSFRVPTIDELYHPTQAGLSGNPALSAETAWESELFGRVSLGDLSFELAGFARRTSDLILYLNRNAFEIRPENLGTANLLGLESSARLRRVVGPVLVDLGVSGSLLAGQLEQTGEAWPTLAPHGAAAEASIASEHLEFSTQARYAASTAANLAGTLETEPYLRWDAALVLRPFPEATLAFSVTNLLDRRDLETINKIPLPGRTALFSVRVSEAIL